MVGVGCSANDPVRHRHIRPLIAQPRDSAGIPTVPLRVAQPIEGWLRRSVNASGLVGVWDAVAVLAGPFG